MYIRTHPKMIATTPDAMAMPHAHTCKGCGVTSEMTALPMLTAVDTAPVVSNPLLMLSFGKGS